MMDQHDAKHVLARKLSENFAEPTELRRAERARRHEGRRRQRGRQTDESDRIAPPHEGKLRVQIAVSPHEVPPLAFGFAQRRMHVDVVIAWNERDVVWRTEPLEPGTRSGEFL